jgi:hypothetical protein
LKKSAADTLYVIFGSMELARRVYRRHNLSDCDGIDAPAIMSTPESKRQQRSRADFSVALPTPLYGNSHDALTFQFKAT